MNETRAKVQSIERRVQQQTDEALERHRQQLLQKLSEQYSSLSPQLQESQQQINELKAHLSAVHDADLMSDSSLQAITTEHCLSHAVRLVDLVTSDRSSDRTASYAVLELVSSTIAMFANRPSAIDAILSSGSVQSIVTLLSPLFPSIVVINVANAIGSLAHDQDCRISFRSAGGIGALVRLLRSDVDTPAQTAAAAAISLLSARDVSVQDSIRYLGGIDLLVELLADPDVYLNEVARYSLLSLRQGNVKNQAEIVTAVRANVRLSRDVLKLSLASDLLKFEDRTPVKLPAPSYSTSYRSSIGGEDSGVVRASITSGSPLRYTPPPRGSYSPSLGYNKTPLPDSSYRPVSAPRLPNRSTFDVTSHGGSYASPLKPSAASTYRSPSRASAEYLPTARLLRYSAAMNEALLSSPMATPDDAEWRIGASLVEVESEILKKKHLARFTPEEVSLLLEEMGFDRLDLRGFRAGRVDGLRLLELSEEEMMVDMVLQRLKIRKVQMLQKAVKLFDRIGER